MHCSTSYLGFRFAGWGSITCLYAAPLYLSGANASDQSPVAWAVQTGKPPRGLGKRGVITGTGRFWWWLGTRKDYQRAIDEVILQRFPRQLGEHCRGQQPVGGSSKCRSAGLEPCRRPGGGCCCPVGYRVHRPSGQCVPCGVVEHVKALRDLPLVYILYLGKFLESREDVQASSSQNLSH